MPEKVSPYHAVDKDFSLEKVALQTGVASPSQVGISLKKKPKGEESALEMRSKKPSAPKGDKKEGGPGEPGRPKNSDDKTKRKERTFKPATKARIELWAKKAQEVISELVNPVLLKEFNKKNMRSLSSDEKNKSERAKFEILCNLDCNQEVSMKTVANAIQSEPIGASVHEECDSWILQAVEEYGRRLTIEEIRSLRASFYAHFAAKN